MKIIIIFFIRIYQKLMGFLNLRVCRFYPSCSEYMIEGINKNGLWKGMSQGICRVLRCNPFNPGGYDPK